MCGLVTSTFALCLLSGISTVSCGGSQTETRENKRLLAYRRYTKAMPTSKVPVQNAGHFALSTFARRRVE